jgi:hypothetical protein
MCQPVARIPTGLQNAPIKIENKPIKNVIELGETTSQLRSKKRTISTILTSESSFSSVSQTPTTPNIDEAEKLIEEDENETSETEID